MGTKDTKDTEDTKGLFYISLKYRKVIRHHPSKQFVLKRGLQGLVLTAGISMIYKFPVVLMVP